MEIRDWPARAGVAATLLLLAFAPVAAHAQAAGPIRIGVPAPLSGSSANAGIDIVNAAKLAAGDINAKGGVMGRQIEIVAEDDACDAQTAVQAAQKMIDSGVVGVAGGSAPARRCRNCRRCTGATSRTCSMPPPIRN